MKPSEKPLLRRLAIARHNSLSSRSDGTQESGTKQPPPPTEGPTSTPWSLPRAEPAYASTWPSLTELHATANHDGTPTAQGITENV